MTESRDFASLIELLSLQRDEYGLLVSLSRGQKQLFEREGVPALMRIMGRKQQVINRLTVRGVELEPYKKDWAQTMAALPSAGRREVADLTDEIAQLIEKLVASESEIRDLVAASAKRLGKEAETARNETGLARVYSNPAPVMSGQVLDGEG